MENYTYMKTTLICLFEQSDTYSFLYSFTAILICTSADEIGQRTLEALDQLRLGEEFESLNILVDIATLPMWLPTFINASREELGNNENLTTSYHMKKYLLLFTDTELKLKYR